MIYHTNFWLLKHFNSCKCSTYELTNKKWPNHYKTPNYDDGLMHKDDGFMHKSRFFTSCMTRSFEPLYLCYNSVGSAYYLNKPSNCLRSLHILRLQYVYICISQHFFFKTYIKIFTLACLTIYSKR